MKIFLADDQTMFRSALASLLALEDDVHIAGQASTADEALIAIRQSAPDIALLDVQMPGNGLNLARRLVNEKTTTHLVICTTFDRPGYAAEAISIGCAGFITKEEPPEVLLAQLRKVMAGERVIAPHLALNALQQGNNPLTPREIEVLKVSANGLELGEVARQLHLSRGTVKNYLSSTISKLGVQTRTQAHHRATEQGWLE